jgi:hypothetical protein
LSPTILGLHVSGPYDKGGHHKQGNNSPCRQPDPFAVLFEVVVRYPKGVGQVILFEFVTSICSHDIFFVAARRGLPLSGPLG